MNRQRGIAVIIIIALILLIIKWGLFNKHASISDGLKANDSFRDLSHLILTKHARCRMDCRHITEEEIKEIIKGGEVNYNKSGPGSKGDETYALEGYDNEHQHLRVVVAPESDGLVVITCIDLDKEWQCNCE